MKWRTEIRKLSELKNWESNPRIISEEHFEELVSSIDDLGNFEPLVIDTDGTVIAGNQRLRVAQKLGQTEVEVSVPERKLTEQEIKKIGVISNRHSGEWDMDKLANEFEDVLTELGFDDLMPEVELDVKEDDYEEPEDLEVKVKKGEVWQLGKHRLMCGDSTKIEDVEKLMDGQKADMVFTDPPYNVDIDSRSKKRGLGKIKNDDMGDEEFLRFLNQAIGNIFISSKDESPLYVWHSYREQRNFELALNTSGYEVRNQIIWVKDIPSYTNIEFRQQHENLFYCNKIGFKCNSYRTKGNSVIEVASIQSAKSIDDSGNKWFNGGSEGLNLHTTQKPVGVIVPFVETSSIKENIILDLFGGSGSTLIACEQTNRKCYMMELDTHYCQVIIDRWEKFTGKEVIKLGD